MDEAPSSDLRRARVRTLVQGSVLLAVALGLWLIGGGPRRPLPLEAPLPVLTAPALSSPDPSPSPSSTRIAFLPTHVAPTASPSGVQADPPDVLTASVPPSTPQDVGRTPRDVGRRDDAPPVRAGGGELPREAPIEAASELEQEGAGIVVLGVFIPLPLTPESSSVAPIPTEATNQWVWPLHGEISQGYSSGHRAIDLSAEQGTVVVAADAGTVVYARWQSSGYGYLVIIDHHNGFVSYYGHLYGFYIDAGQEVTRGEQIGELGTTGRSTGPHLHFEIRQDGVQRNPLDLLP